MSGQKPAMWAYIIVLSLTVFIIWIFFFKKEIRLTTDNNDSQPSLGEILSDFKDSVGQGSHLIEEIKEETKKVDLEEAEEELTKEQKENLLNKVREQLNK